MDHQDWTPVGWNKVPTGQAARSNQAVNAARRAGKAVDVEEKFTSGNRAAKNTITNAVKLDADNENYEIVLVCKEFQQALQQARLAKKMTQAALANAINEKPTVIQEYENGKAIPNGAIIQKLNRALGVNLPKAKGKPKPKPKD